MPTDKSEPAFERSGALPLDQHASCELPEPHARHVMQEPPNRRQLGRWLLVSAVVVGTTADILLRRDETGLPLAALLLTIIGSTAVVVRFRLHTIPRIAARLLSVSALFTILMIVRSSEPLLQFNLLGAAVAGMLAVAFAAATASPSATFRLLQMRDVLRAIAFTAKNAAFGAFGFLQHDARDVMSMTSVRLYATRLVVRSVVLSIVVVTVFAALLSAGDPVFAEAVALPFQWRLKPMLNHALIVAAVAWPILGVQWATTMGKAATPDRQLKFLDTDWRILSRLDVVVILASLNALFAVFILVQLRVLFGGLPYVLATTGLTLADYARSGFFTLLATSALVLITLLGLNAVSRGGGVADWHVTRRLSLSLLAFVALVLTSSAVRMTLYVNAFGASSERFYSYGMMLWLAGVLLLFARTVLRHQPAHFTVGALASAWATLLVFNVVNVPALVTRVNLARFHQGSTFDLSYARTLGADAVPTLVAGIVNANETELRRMNVARVDTSYVPACQDIALVLRDWNENAAPKGDGWTVSRWRARNVVAANAAALQARACAIATPAAVARGS